MQEAGTAGAVAGEPEGAGAIPAGALPAGGLLRDLLFAHVTGVLHLVLGVQFLPLLSPCTCSLRRQATQG